MLARTRNAVEESRMTRLLFATAAFAAMCGVTVATISTELAPAARAAPPAVASIDVYKDAS